MKFVANVEVSDRLAASYNMSKRRSQRSSLTFGTKPGNSNELILVLQSNQNSLGTVYKVKGNIERVFDKYAKNGKMTIRFKEPPHDLIINCETSVLVRFLPALKMGMDKNVSTKCLKLPVASSEPLKKIPPKPKQHLVYTSNAEYPVCEGFPKSAVTITINGLQKTRFDMRLLGLPYLKVLNLGDNQLMEIPVELNLLPQLRVLSVAGNRLGTAAGRAAWAWLRGTQLVRQLQELDLSNNELRVLSPAVCQLKALHTLKVACNQLTQLPGAIGLMKTLKSLVASNNKLTVLPGSILQLKFHHLDITQNDYALILWSADPKDCKVPSLLECAARRVISSRLYFGPEDLPVQVQIYLDTVSFCRCGQPSFQGPPIFALKDVSHIAESFVHRAGSLELFPLKFIVCSPQCARL